MGVFTFNVLFPSHKHSMIFFGLLFLFDLFTTCSSMHIMRNLNNYLNITKRTAISVDSGTFYPM